MNENYEALYYIHEGCVYSISSKGKEIIIKRKAIVYTGKEETEQRNGEEKKLCVCKEGAQKLSLNFPYTYGSKIMKSKHAKFTPVNM